MNSILWLAGIAHVFLMKRKVYERIKSPREWRKFLGELNGIRNGIKHCEEDMRKALVLHDSRLSVVHPQEASRQTLELLRLSEMHKELEREYAELEARGTTSPSPGSPPGTASMGKRYNS